MSARVGGWRRAQQFELTHRHSASPRAALPRHAVPGRGCWAAAVALAHPTHRCPPTHPTHHCPPHLHPPTCAHPPAHPPFLSGLPPSTTRLLALVGFLTFTIWMWVGFCITCCKCCTCCQCCFWAPRKAPKDAAEAREQFIEQVGVSAGCQPGWRLQRRRRQRRWQRQTLLPLGCIQGHSPRCSPPLASRYHCPPPARHMYVLQKEVSSAVPELEAKQGKRGWLTWHNAFWVSPPSGGPALPACSRTVPREGRLGGGEPGARVVHTRVHRCSAAARRQQHRRRRRRRVCWHRCPLWARWLRDKLNVKFVPLHCRRSLACWRWR